MFVCYLAADFLFLFKGAASFQFIKTVYKKLALMEQISAHRQKFIVGH
jgi:hypothetical protein